VEKGGAKCHRVVATSHSGMVREFVAAPDGKAGQEGVRAQSCETGDIQSCLAGLIGNDIKVVIVPLRARFVMGPRAGGVEPGGMERVVIVVDGAAAREARQ